VKGASHDQVIIGRPLGRLAEVLVIDQPSCLIDNEHAEDHIGVEQKGRKDS